MHSGVRKCLSPQSSRIASALTLFVMLSGCSHTDPPPTDQERLDVPEVEVAQRQFQFSGSSFRCAALSPDKRLLAVGGGIEPGETAFFQVWDTKSGKETCSQRLHDNATDATSAHNNVVSMTFLADGKALVVHDHLGYSLWSIDPVRQRHFIKESGLARGLAVSSDGKQLALPYAELRDGLFQNITVLDVDSGKELYTLSGVDGGVAESLVFSPDGKLLFGAVGTHLAVWDTAAKDLLVEKQIGFNVESVGLSADGRTVAVFGGGTLFIYDVKGNTSDKLALQLLQELRSPFAVAEPLAFSADGTVLFGFNQTWLHRGGEWNVGPKLAEPIVAVTEDRRLVAMINLQSKTVRVVATEKLLLQLLKTIDSKQK